MSEPEYESGAFSLVAAGDGRWGVYDAYDNRIHLTFAKRDTAIAAIDALDESTQFMKLDAEYDVWRPIARAELGQKEA